MNRFISKYLIWYPAFLLRGQKVRSGIKFFQKTQYYDRDQLREFQFGKMKEQITFAYEHIPFYQDKYNEAMVHPDDIRSPDDLGKIPILTKEEISKHSNAISNSHHRYPGWKFRRSTSGSTGMPLVFYKDSLSMGIMDAILYRNYSWLGIEIGYRQARFWGHPLTPRGLLKTRLTDRTLNRVRLSPFRLEDKTYRLYLEEIERFRAQYVYGYAQSVFQFARYFHRKEMRLSHLRLKGVILTGEIIFPEQVKIIRQVFACEVSEEYGCTEVGVIGFRDGNENMHLMENLLVESVHNFEDGTSGNLILSELYGKFFPFIRYQIGDRGSIVHKKCPCGRSLPILENISGRKDEYIQCSDGRLVDPYVLEYIINEMPASYGRIYQFKIIFIKEENHLRVSLIAEKFFNKIRNHIQNEFGKYLTADMRISICFVSKLERDLSGKQRCFISKDTEKTVT
ncbi:MAG: hypothetical protein B6245_16065 [Desulfobacteraceae bacterium 4572_88]|nr:MAG: hypothetical protein B6245_16065 [Desulfobacteraceae bacterium 4572_88]RLC18037.1 MAG: hypothetical protein DRI57_08980 [Deltaproteobacteria bacterium]